MKRFKCTFVISGGTPYKIEFSVMATDFDSAKAIVHVERMDLYKTGHTVAAFYFLKQIHAI